MKPTLFNNLSADDTVIMTELEPVLDISYAKPLEGGSALYYQLFTWLDGESPHRFIHHLSPAEQYALGVQVGETARLLHTLPALPSPHKRVRDNPWCVWWKEDLLGRIKEYESKPDKTRAHKILIKYLRDNIDLVDGRPQTFIHGDWDTSNYIFMPDGKIGIIDTGDTCGDPWMEFRYSNGTNDGPYFDSGQINGYFSGNPPVEYFPLLLLYTADSTLGRFLTGIGINSEFYLLNPGEHYKFAGAFILYVNILFSA